MPSTTTNLPTNLLRLASDAHTNSNSTSSNAQQQRLRVCTAGFCVTHARPRAERNFIGPVCYPCLTPPCTSPPSPGPAPGPAPGPCTDCVEIGHPTAATAGIRMCLTAAAAKKQEPVTVAACAGGAAAVGDAVAATATAVWHVDKKSGGNTLLFEDEPTLCLRPTQPPMIPADCKVGTSR